MHSRHPKRQVKIRITPPMRLILSAASKLKASHHHTKLGLNHWLTALRELFPILPDEATWDDIKVMDIRSRLKEGDVGPVLSKERVLADATKLAKAEGLQSPTAYELVRVVLSRAKLIKSGTERPMDAFVDGEDLLRKANGSRSEAAPEAAVAEPQELVAPSGSATPTLDRFGRDLTSDAEAGLLCRIVNRDNQVGLMVESLCRTTKRNIALIGPAGVGKRGLVECLAARIKAGLVPKALISTRIVEVQFIAIVAGCTGFEELSSRVAAIAQEASIGQTVLFFDDLRAVMAAGAEGPGAAIAGQLKPDIVSGRLTCIVSGSEQDYRRITEVDPTWQSWFQPIRVDELTADETLEALDAIAEHTQTMTGMQVPRPVRRWIVEFAREFLKSHRFPGKAANLLEQTIAHAVSQKAKKVTLKHAHAVAERAIGVPTEMQSRFAKVSAELASSGVLVPEDRKRLEERLSVTLRSLDLRPERPNAVLLLVGEAASWGHALAETLAMGIAGSSERVIAIDLSTFDEAWDIRHLVGGTDGKPAREAHALSRLIDAPWSVVLLSNVDGCHPHVRATITRALEAGYITDVTGRKIHLSDTIVVFTAPTIARAGRGPLGFIEPENGATGADAVTQVLGKEMAGMLDLVVAEVDVESPPAKATRKRLFEDLARRYRTRGLRMTLDQSVIDWLSADSQQRRTQEEWDRWVDHELAAALIPYLPAKPSDAMRSVVVRQTPSGLIVEATKKADAAKRAAAR